MMSTVLHLSHYASLRKRLSDTSLTDLTDLPSVAEREITNYIYWSIPDILPSCVSWEVELLPNRSLNLDLGQVTYDLAQDIEDPYKLVIVFSFIGVELPSEYLKTRRVTRKVGGLGHIKTISVVLPKLLEIDAQKFLTVVCEIVEGSYNVVSEVIADRLATSATELSRQLYLTFKSYCLSKEVKDDLWFAAISSDRGFRLVDSEVSENMMSSLPVSFRRSQFSLASEILDTALPVKGLLMKEVFNMTGPVDVDISDADYDQNKTSYSEAMRSLYRGSSFTIHPIYCDGSWAVLALSSTKFRNEVNGILSHRRGEFEEICRNSKRLVNHSLKYLTKRNGSIPWVGLGQMIGAAKAEFIKGMAK